MASSSRLFPEGENPPTNHWEAYFNMRKLSLFFIVALVSCCGVHAATISVPSATTTVQAAINAANPGDVIEITDGATYNEDTNIPLGKNNLTIRGVGSMPTILATNTVGRSIGTRLVYVASNGLAPVGTPDAFGMLVEGNGTTLENVIIQNNGPAFVPDGFTGALALVGDDTTITNCILRGGTLTENEFCLSNICGNWPIIDAAIAAAGPPLSTGWGTGLAGIGYTTPTSADNVTVTDVDMDRGSNLLGVGDYSRFIIAEFTSAVGPAREFIPPTPSQNWTFTNVVLTGIDGEEVMESAIIENAVFNNCTIQGVPDGGLGGTGVFKMGGGSWIFNDCLFRDLPGGELLQLEASDDLINFGGGDMNIFANRSVFCGANSEAGIVQVTNGNATFRECIFNVQDTDGTSALDLDLGNWEREDGGDTFYTGSPTPGAFFGGFGSTNGIPFPATHGVILDQCDIYTPNGGAFAVSIRNLNAEDAAEPEATVTITNTNITSSGNAINAGTIVNATGQTNSINVSYSNLLSLGGSQIVGGDWTVNASNNVDPPQDPQYLDPLSCPNPLVPDLYAYSNFTVATSGSVGQPLGAVGPFGGVPSDVQEWRLYD
jgi:hypothetical protein